MQVQEGTGSVATATKPERNYTLKELAEGFKEIEAAIIDNGGEVSDDLYELHQVAQNLLAGKFDRVIRFKSALEVHIAACKTQIQNNTNLIERIDQMVEESVRSQKDQRIEGTAYVGKVVKNTPSVIVLNEEEVPGEYKNVKVEASAKFPMADVAEYIKWRNFIVGRVVGPDGMTPDEKALVDDHFEITVDKKKVARDAKTKEIPGIRMEQGSRIDIKAGKAKPKMLGESNATQG